MYLSDKLACSQIPLECCVTYLWEIFFFFIQIVLFVLIDVILQLVSEAKRTPKSPPLFYRIAMHLLIRYIDKTK